jgi:hypothetical protein
MNTIQTPLHQRVREYLSAKKEAACARWGIVGTLVDTYTDEELTAYVHGADDMGTEYEEVISAYNARLEELDAVWGKQYAAVYEENVILKERINALQELSALVLNEHSHLAQAEAKEAFTDDCCTIIEKSRPSVAATDQMCEAAREAFANSTARDFYSHWRAALEAALCAAQPSLLA